LFLDSHHEFMILQMVFRDRGGWWSSVSEPSIRS
jgi:hypothetical protein